MSGPEVIKRCAGAIADCCYDGAQAREIALSVVAEFIAAIREPSEAMLIAARDWSRQKYGKPIGNDDATGCWRAMHTSLMKELGL